MAGFNFITFFWIILLVALVIAAIFLADHFGFNMSHLNPAKKHVSEAGPVIEMQTIPVKPVSSVEESKPQQGSNPYEVSEEVAPPIPERPRSSESAESGSNPYAASE